MIVSLAVCESTHTGNQSDHQTTAEMQWVDLFHCLTNSARKQRHMGTQFLLGLANPSKKLKQKVYTNEH